jgi:hypothetical protein
MTAACGGAPVHRAAVLMTAGGAQAADLPVKAKVVEYVRICSRYGVGFWFIPAPTPA